MAKKLPIWIKHKGKYHPIPYHLMTTFADGKRGIHPHDTWLYYYPNIDNEICKFYHDHYQYFYYEDQGANRRLIFLGYKRHDRLYIACSIAAIVSATITCINLATGYLFLAAITTACAGINVLGMCRRYRNYF